MKSTWDQLYIVLAEKHIFCNFDPKWPIKLMTPKANFKRLDERHFRSIRVKFEHFDYFLFFLGQF